MLQRLWLSRTRRPSLTVVCKACHCCALYSTGRVFGRSFSAVNSCDVGRPNLTEESAYSSARMGARNNKNASQYNSTCFVLGQRRSLVYKKKKLCIQWNMGERTLRDSKSFCNMPTKCTCTIKYMYCYQHSATCFGAYCAIFRDNFILCPKLVFNDSF